MKRLNTVTIRLIVLAIVIISFSCKKLQDSPQPSDEETLTPTDSALYVPQAIFTPAQHTFTDIHICYDDKVFLLENGKLKRLVGTNLVDLNWPALVYNNFNPTYLAISKDFTFYLRASTGIKVIKAGRLIKEYTVGQAPLQDFTAETFGEYPVAVDETDQSLIVGVQRLFNPGLVSTLKITKNGQVGLVSPDEGTTEGAFFTTFDVGGTPGQLWMAGLSAFNDFYFAKMYVFTVAAQSFDYILQDVYGIGASNHLPFPLEGHIDSVGYRTTAGIRISKDAKTIYLKTGEYNTGSNTVGNTGFVLRIRNNYVTAIAEEAENKRMAISKDGKTLYLAGNGLYKIEF
ncbi:hypothetical protein EOD41_13190 [Mucilaginibacter limnophilus]|uniref:Uncharacterized protein n=1 Tax=Mucilaginibacter limnophilus TaxID=1932778 RepID=A0A3S2Y089_9SPHI|nr:hypothetical protein [Mucilaginibacter limnophilus]RVU00427.1 hypothetical protein EOD41_13190 [Mucilaginibacter limnophilus]